MSQHAQHCLIRFLLVWVCMLSISQVVLITVYLTAGHHKQHQNRTDVVTPLPSKANNPTLPSPETKPCLGKGIMLNFNAMPTTVNETVTWRSRYPNDLLTVKEQVLTVAKDGYYFLNLRVTLKMCKNVSLLAGHSNLMVTVIWTKKQGDVTTILEGRINMDTCSTGLLARVIALSSEATLETKINMKNPLINYKETLTHLDIIFMPYTL